MTLRRTVLALLATSLLGAPAAMAVQRAPLDATNKPDLGKAATEPKKTNSATELEGEKRTEMIGTIEKYLSSISSIVADFSQESTDGSVGDGKFFLKRPGKMRWQYNPPNPLLLVSNGKVITYYDPGLDQVTYVDIDDTLAGFLARGEIKLDQDSTKLTKLVTNNGQMEATVIQRKKPDEGSITLILTEKPMELKQILTTDATGNQTRVTLSKAQFGPVLDDKLFIFEDKRSVNRKRNSR